MVANRETDREELIQDYYSQRKLNRHQIPRPKKKTLDAGPANGNILEEVRGEDDLPLGYL